MSIYCRQFLFSVLVFALAVPGTAFGAYRNRGKRDLFVPLLTADGQRIYPPGTDDATEGAGAFLLQGIVFDPEAQSYAIINGQVVRELGSIGGMTLIEIKPNEVVLELEGQPLILNLQKIEPEEADRTP